MLFKNIGYHFLLPFRNLSTQARFLQVIRFFTCSVAFALIVTAMLGSLINRNIYIARINCAHLDVSSGLYKTLRNSVTLSPSILDDGDDDVLPVDSSLTNSEISVLTDYAESQVVNAPQYIITSLWSWCYGNYNITQHEDKYGVTHFTTHNDVLTCSRNMRRYIFDYRDELESVGLESILAYAYQSSDLNDKHYEKTVSERNKKFKLVPSGLIFSSISHLIVLIFGYILYSNRGQEKDLNKIPVFLLNIIALISVSSFIGITVSGGLVTNLLVQIRHEVSKNLGDYGISLHFGDVWFLLMWVSFAFSFISMLSWTFPLWCANPLEFDEEEGFDNSSYRSENMTNDEETDLGSLGRNQSASSKFDRLNKSGRHKSSGVQFNGLTNHDNKESEVEERDFSDNDDYDDDEYLYNDANNRKYDVYGARNEDELRRLGETLSRKMSVRRLNRKFSKNHSNSHAVDEKCSVPEDESISLLYHNVNMNSHQYPMTDSMARHYREDTFDGYVNSHKPTTSTSTMSPGMSKNLTSHSNRHRDEDNNTPIRNILENSGNTGKYNREQYDANFRSNSLHERHFQHDTGNNPFLQSCTLEPVQNKRDSTGDSFLNHEEMEILDNNNYINRI